MAPESITDGAVPTYDLLVVGGGINGAGIARDAAGRGLGVLLCERGDLAAFTSSSSTKLIHGGLRYLETYAFRLVREALAERERLMRLAPHIIWPLRFVLPHESSLRPAWMLRLGLLLYDNLSRLRTLPRSGPVDLRSSPCGAPLQARLTRGFAYSDCWVEDSRLVILNAMDAAARGAAIRTRTELRAARRVGTVWEAELRDMATGGRTHVRARALVNAAGPWVGETLDTTLGLDAHAAMRLVKGSHIVVKALYAGDHAYILQQPDRRIIFALPYEGDFTLIGTTDVPHAGPPGPVTISEGEVDYLCAAINRSFQTGIGPADVVWSYAGIRPLHDDAAREASAVSRDYLLDLDAPGGQAPALSVYGGKITTYRRLAEHVLDRLGPHLPRSAPDSTGRPWTGDAPLPGGDIPQADFDGFLAEFARAAPFLPMATARRLARAYGTRARTLLGDARSLADLGEAFEGGLTGREVDYLVRAEWARTAEDILWRRSKLGLRTSPEGAARLADYLARHGGTGSVRAHPPEDRTGASP